MFGGWWVAAFSCFLMGFVCRLVVLFCVCYSLVALRLVCLNCVLGDLL